MVMVRKIMILGIKDIKAVHLHCNVCQTTVRYERTDIVGNEKIRCRLCDAEYPPGTHEGASNLCSAIEHLRQSKKEVVTLEIEMED